MNRNRHAVNVHRRRVLLCLLLLDDDNNRRWHTRPTNANRLGQGDYHNLISEMRLGDHDNYFVFMRMSPNQFDALLHIVGPMLQNNSRRQPLSPAERLAMTLRYLASGNDFTSISFSFRVGLSTVSKIIAETTLAIWIAFKPFVFMELNEGNWLKVAEDFKILWQYPNCIGTLDGKHCVIQKLPNSGSAFFNYKSAHIIVLLALCDARYCFTIVDIGAPGRHCDGAIFAASRFGRALNNRQLHIPPPRTLPNSEKVSPFVIVADAAFPLKENIMRPYPDRRLTPSKRIYNYRHSRARRVSENAFGILSHRWRVFRRPMHTKQSTVCTSVKAAVCLHNWLMKGNHNNRNRYCPQGMADEEDADGMIRPGAWREDAQYGAMQNMPLSARNQRAVNAVTVRNTFEEYFAGEGAVPWQWNVLPNM